VGCEIGRKMVDKFDKAEDAIEAFEAVYFDKTGNEWAARKFATKKPNKYFPLEMDYEEVKIKKRVKKGDFFLIEIRVILVFF
jgi:hypothetical protein